jgi:DNA polymerase III subunit gamma/tau
MGIALYRKYRPQTFGEITGQNHVRVTLENELKNGSVAHAYLFTGPRGVGKTSLARIFAKALNCLGRKAGESEPCNECAACLEQQQSRALDVIEIDAASNTGVDNVRENIIEHVRFAPVSRRFKVFIIDEVHMLSASAWNALLKTLEEPPAHAVFVMATTEINKVPATIISRCQRFDFKRIPFELMAERLKHLAAGEGVSVDDAVIEAVVKLGDGCLRDAESLLEQVLSLDEKRIGEAEAALVLPRSNSQLVIEFIDALAERRGGDAIALIDRLIGEGVDLQQFAVDAIERLRSLLLVALGASSKAVSTEATRRLSVAHLIRLVNSMNQARIELKSAVIPQLPLELVAAEHCGDAAASAANSKFPLDSARGRQKPDSKEITNPESQKPNKDAPPSVVTSETTKQSPPVEAKPPHEVEPRLAKLGEVQPLRPEVSPQIPLETLALRWDELCAAVQDENPSLPFILRVARPVRFEDGTLVIGVQYKLHADKLNQAKNINSVTRGLTTLYKGAIIPVRAEIMAAADLEPAAGAVTDGLLEQFGGTVVE